MYTKRLCSLILCSIICQSLFGQWTSSSLNVQLNSSNIDKPVTIFNSDVPNPITYGGGKLRVVDDGTNAQFDNVATFHGLNMRSSNEQILRLNFTRFSPESTNMVLLQGTENQTDQKFRIDTEGDASFEGSLRVLDLGYTGSTSTAMSVRGDEAIWYDGNAFSWGFGGEYNRFADPVIFGSSGAPASGIQIRIDQGGLQLKEQDIFLDETTTGRISFRSDDGSIVKSIIASASNSLTINDLARMHFQVNGEEELGLLPDQVLVSGDLEMNQDRSINFHSDTFWTVPRASMKRSPNGTLRLDNLEQNKEVIISSEGGEITINNSIGATVTLESAFVGINEKNPEHALHVNGNVGITGDFFVLSDRRMKKDIKSLDQVMSKLIALEPSHYSWKNKSEHSIGLIAQDVEKVFPELVHTSESGTKMVNYQALSVLAIQGLKEQEKRISSLENALSKVLQELDSFKSD